MWIIFPERALHNKKDFIFLNRQQIGGILGSTELYFDQRYEAGLAKQKHAVALKVLASV